MKGRILGAILAAIGLISLASLGAILLFIPPETDPVLLPALLTSALFLSLASALTFIGLRLRRSYETDANREKIFAISFREAIIFSLLVIGFLWLEHFGNLTIWIAAIAVASALAIEYFFLLRHA